MITKIKSLILMATSVLLAVLTIAILSISDVQAASGTAAIKAFNVNNMIYNDDKSAGYYQIETPDNYYGKINLWAAVYSYYDTSDDTKYFSLLWEAEIESSTYQSSIKRFVNRNIEVKISSNYDAIEKIGSRPNSDNFEGGYETTATIKAEIDSDDGFKVGGSFSTTSHYKELSLVTTQDMRSVLYNFEFTRYASNSINKKAPYRGNYKQHGIVIFQVEDYSTEHLLNKKIVVDFKGTIFKDHWIKNENLYGNRSLTFTYNSSSGKFEI